MHTRITLITITLGIYPALFLLLGTLKMWDWNMQDRNMRHQIAGVEYAGLENAAPTWNEKSREHR